ncbi:MAG: fibronectin type III domain-containing protein, partial [Ilumatobacteraceae bacterium]|nr:fibronectin type III domain-containing protein [Ilumatobacteraceae bacterium]
MSVRRSMRQPIGLVAACVAGALVIAACGASESSTGDRDRNVGGGVLFASAVDGVARNRIGDASLVAPTELVDRRQTDGRTIVGLVTLAMDKSGSRNELSFMQVGPGTGFDTSFGTNAIRRIVIEGDALVQPILGPDGRFVVPHLAFEDTGNQQVVGLSRYDLATGELDPTFGSGGDLDINPVYVQDLSSLTVDNGGGVLVVGTESNTQVKWDAWRWTAQGLDSSFGKGGRLDLAPPTNVDLANDEDFSCARPTLASKPDGQILALYGCLKFRNILTDAGNQLSDFTQMMGVREFTGNGEPIGEPRLITLDTPNETDGGVTYLNIVDVDFGSGPNASSTYVTIESNFGQEVLAFNDNMGRFDRPAGLGPALGAILPRYAKNTRRVTPLGLSRFIAGPTTVFVGIGTELESASTVLEVGQFPMAENQIGFPKFFPSDTSVPIAGYPSIQHSYDRIDYVGDDIFMNLPATGYSLSEGFASADGLVAAQSGYLMIDRSGTTRPPFGSANGIALYPAREGADDPDVVHSPGMFPARDGSLYTLSYKTLPFEEGDEMTRVKYFIGHYKANGERIETINFEAEGFSPLFLRTSVHDFDGVDNFYLGGFTPNGFGAVKLSLKAGGYDKNYGENGFVVFPSPFQDLSRSFNSRLRVQPDGSLDVFHHSWVFTSNEDGSFGYPLHISTVRYTPVGAIDSTKPQMTVAFPDLALCSCPQDSLSLEAARNAVVDAAGRLVVVVPDLRFVDENGNLLSVISAQRSRNGVTFDQVNGTEEAPRTLGGGWVRRYTRDGLPDQTFGVEGNSYVSLYEIGAEVPLAVPSLAVSAEGNILLAATGLELDIPEGINSELDLAIKGEYSYAVLLNDSGQLINFTPQTPDPAVRRVADIINDSRTEFGATAPAAPPVAVPDATGNTPAAAEQAPVAAAVTAPPGLGADIVVPAQVVQVNPTKRPIITVLGTPADRAVDVRWSVPESLVGSSASYTVTASPGGQKCTTSTNSCVFKGLEPWTTYTFSIATVSASSSGADVAPLVGIKPVRVLARDTRIDPTKLITPASTGKRTWRATGGCKVTKDGKLFTTPKDGGLCTLSLTA